MSDSLNQIVDRIRNALEQAMTLTDNYPLGPPDNMPSFGKVYSACSVALEDVNALLFAAQEGSGE